MNFQLTSTAFEANQVIPGKYTCDGENISPPLSWSEPPPGTKSFAIIMDDPDAPAGIWVHWVLFNIPSETRMLNEGIPTHPMLKDGSRQGNNTSRRCGYSGPCPPRGTHRYFFKLYALDRLLDLPDGTEKNRLLDAMRGHVLAEAVLMGTYRR